ncbi:MAG: hypothetical protein ACYDCK_06280 [Thermoplasmatota archaeon]
MMRSALGLVLALAFALALPSARADPPPRDLYGCYAAPTLVLCAWGDYGSTTPTRSSVTEGAEAGNRGIADGAVFVHVDTDGKGGSVPRLEHATLDGVVFADGIFFAEPFFLTSDDTNGDDVPDQVSFLDPVAPVFLP